MKFAKKLRDVTPERNLVYLLHEHLSGGEAHRGVKTVHASELTKPEGFCPRFYALADKTKAKLPSSWLTASENVTFALGRWLQDQVVTWFAEMGKAVAHWKCLMCGTLHEFQKRPLGCETCGGQAFKPVEVRFVSAETGASCGVDMLVALGEPKLTPVEIKTIKADGFKPLLGPLAEHRHRTNLYLRIIGESAEAWSNMISSTKALVLYVTKGGYGCAAPELKGWGLHDGFSPFKLYEVQRNDAQTEQEARRARVVKRFRDGEIGMPHGICATALSKRALSCPLKGACFSGDHPALFDWQHETAEAEA